MRYTLDELSRLNTAGDRYGHITPGVVAELIAEVRRLRDRREGPGTPSARMEYLHGELDKRFPGAHNIFDSSSPEPKYLAAIDALVADAERYRWAISLEDNVEQLYAAVVSCGPDMPGSINIEIDAHRAKEPK